MTNDTSPASDAQSPMPRITDAERRGWQRRAVAALSDILDIGTRERLTPLSWIVNHLGALVGDVVTPYTVDEALHREAMRTTWHEWVDALDADPWPSSREPGAVHLSAETTVRRSVRVVLRARLPLPTDQPEDAA